MAEARKGNGFDPKLTTIYVGDIERHFETILSYTGEHMSRCRSVRDMINDVYARAADSGIPKKELKAVIKARKLEAQAKAARDDLDDMERQETFDQIRLALGDLSDLPLGQAARAEAGDPEAQVDPDKAAADANAAALRVGIKEMSEEGKAKARSGKNGRKANAEALDDLTERATGGGAEDDKDLRPDFLKTGSVEPAIH